MRALDPQHRRHSYNNDCGSEVLRMSDPCADSETKLRLLSLSADGRLHPPRPIDGKHAKNWSLPAKLQARRHREAKNLPQQPEALAKPRHVCTSSVCTSSVCTSATAACHRHQRTRCRYASLQEPWYTRSESMLLQLGVRTSKPKRPRKMSSVSRPMRAIFDARACARVAAPAISAASEARGRTEKGGTGETRDTHPHRDGPNATWTAAAPTWRQAKMTPGDRECGRQRAG